MSFIDVKDIGIQAVSHSRMKTHESCARKAMYKFIQKLQEPGNEAMNRGLEKHKELENWLLCLKGQPYEGTGVAPRGGVYDAIRKDVSGFFSAFYDVHPERQQAFTREWEPCSWFDRKTWMRVVFDYVAMKSTHAVVADYKTGKVYDDHDEQADLYAAAAFKMFPEVVNVDVKFYYLDQNMLQPYNYDRPAEEEQLVTKIEARAERVTSDRTFPTNPSWRCRYCHFRKENGGPCVH